MRVFNILRIISVLAVALLVADETTAQQSFGLLVTPSASSIQVSNSLSYHITVTNLTQLPLPEVLVSNVMPAAVQFVGAQNSQGSYQNYGNIVVFNLLNVGAAQIIPMTLTVQPTASGPFSNTVTVATTGVITFPAVTNVVTLVTNTVSSEADLAVTLNGPLQAVVVNDWMTYRVSATNQGPNPASGILLTNTLPPGVIFKSVSPNLVSVVAGSSRIFNLGTMSSGGFTNLQFTVQPTNAGTLTFSASIGSDILDQNPTNNFASTNITIYNYFSGPLFVVTNSAQILNLQNGLTEQSILLSNNVGTNVFAVRVIVTNLTKRLFNAVGTNNGNPFVVLNTTLPAGGGVNLLLQYSPRGSFPFASLQLQAFAVPPLDLTPPVVASTSKLLKITRIVPRADGTVLIEFPSTLGRTYTMVYSDNIAFSNAAIAPPAVVAPANVVQWIDYGPPTTTSAPTNSPTRFYRVYQNP